MILSNQRILIICPNPKGVAAGQRLKYEQYIDDWESLGHSVYVSNFFSMSGWKILHKPGFVFMKASYTLLGYLKRIFTVFRIRKYDIIYVHMWVTPIGPPIFEMLTRSLAKRLIYDIEDFIIGPEAEHRSGLMRLLKTQIKIGYLIKYADTVIASSPALEDFCREQNQFGNSKYITSSVDCERYVRSYDKTNASDRKVRIGWTGTYTTFEYFKEIRDLLVEFNKDYPFKLVLIGNFEYSDSDLDLELIEWSEQSEIEDLSNIDIGLYPLPSTGFVSGKSGLKAIQYQAMGIPFVASDVGNTPRIMQDGITGFLVHSQKEWREALELLYLDGELRMKMGAAGKQLARQKFSREVVKLQYRSVLFGSEQ